MSPSTLTIREALLQASSFLQLNGVPEARFEAEYLMRHLISCERSALFLRWDEPFPIERMNEWQLWIKRRSRGEPAQYITGEQEFYGLNFTVGPAVLIPRPETELLLEQALSWAKQTFGMSVPFAAADIGTGSGALAVSLAVHDPRLEIVASDISAEALKVASHNAEKHGVENRIRFYEGNLLEPLVQNKIAVAMLLSNPPYIAAGDMPSLQREVRDYEPHTALAGGADGLSFYREILRQIPQLPDIPAFIGVETGMGQAGTVAEWIEQSGFWDRVEIIKDYAGIERHVTAQLTKK